MLYECTLTFVQLKYHQQRCVWPQNKNKCYFHHREYVYLFEIFLSLALDILALSF